MRPIVTGPWSPPDESQPLTGSVSLGATPAGNETVAAIFGFGRPLYNYEGDWWQSQSHWGMFQIEFAREEREKMK